MRSKLRAISGEELPEEDADGPSRKGSIADRNGDEEVAADQSPDDNMTDE